MAAAPLLSSPEVVRVFAVLGRSVTRQRGSHVVMTKEGEVATLAVPNHKEVTRGTSRSLIRAANLTTDEFVAAIGLMRISAAGFLLCGWADFA